MRRQANGAPATPLDAEVEVHVIDFKPSSLPKWLDMTGLLQQRTQNKLALQAPAGRC
jgi:hypothetical protein